MEEPMPVPGDQTEAELAKTRRVVAEAMAEQIATNEGAVREGVADDDEVEEDEPAPKASKKGTR